MLTKEQYEKKCAKFESAKMYDGRGTTDLYVCDKCGAQLRSVYDDKGVTPFTLQCKCGHFMTHVHTMSGVQPNVDIHWVRPSYEYYKALSEAAREHVEMGGLVKKSDLIGLIPHEYK